jgi:rhodanese-related sulfurtransferase
MKTPEQLVENAKQNIEQISVEQAAKICADHKIIDVREADEYVQGHLADARISLVVYSNSKLQTTSLIKTRQSWCIVKQAVGRLCRLRCWVSLAIAMSNRLKAVMKRGNKRVNPPKPQATPSFTNCQFTKILYKKATFYQRRFFAS